LTEVERNRFREKTQYSIPEIQRSKEFSELFNTSNSDTTIRSKRRSLTSPLFVDHDSLISFNTEILMTIRVSNSRLDIVLNKLIEMKEVLWVEPRGEFKVSNYWAKGVIGSEESGSDFLASYGIKGTNQVVGIADTGTSAILLAIIRSY
jgi:hypothetical protein